MRCPTQDATDSGKGNTVFCSDVYSQNYVTGGAANNINRVLQLHTNYDAALKHKATTDVYLWRRRAQLSLHIHLPIIHTLETDSSALFIIAAPIPNTAQPARACFFVVFLWCFPQYTNLKQRHYDTYGHCPAQDDKEDFWAEII